MEKAMGCRISGDIYLWANGTMPFEIDDGDFPAGTSDRQAIDQAITHWNTRTAMRLVARNGQTDFVRFVRAAASCGSRVGRVGGRQDITCAVGAGFNTGEVIHEIGHAAGLWHEQSREDRDSFVVVNSDNITSGQEHNFAKRINDGDDLHRYDYASIMHYGRFAFSNNGLETISPIDAAAQIGQRTELSFTDILSINSIYTGTRFILQTGTALHETDDRFEFEIAENDDLFAVKKQHTGSDSTEIHVLSKDSNYQQFRLQTKTALHETDKRFQFCLARNRDLFAIKKSSTGSNSTEIHVLSAADNYQSFSLHTGTALHETDENFDFVLAANRDLIAIKKRGTGTNSTEVHILSAASGYRDFVLQTGTPLHETSSDFQFSCSSSRDIYVFKKMNTSTNSTEAHILAEPDYQTFRLQKGTLLHTTDSRFDIMSNAQGHLVAIKKRNTGTNSTEVHVVEL